MRRFQAFVSILCTSLMTISTMSAQSSAVRISPPTGGLGWVTRPYQRREVPDIDLHNSDRLMSLIRAGNLYMSIEDVVALAIENNLDVEVQRYGPLLAREVTRRTKGGAALRDVGVAVAAGPQSVSLTGVSSAASGGTSTGAAGSGVSSSGGVTVQLGPAIPVLDPTVAFSAQFQHQTSPNSNTVLTGTTALVTDSRAYQASYSQTLDFGLTGALTYSSQRSTYNSSRFQLNPSTAGSLDLQFTQSFLNGGGRAVNSRNIFVAKNNEKVSDLQFRQQLITTVSAIVNLYWDLVAFKQDQQAKQNGLDVANRLFEDNKKQVAIGTLAPIEVTRAESQVYTSQQDLLVSQTNLAQQETVLKNALSRNGVSSPEIANVHIIPLDPIRVPPSDDIKPINELVGEAMGKRIEVEEAKINIGSQKKNLVGVKNGLRPTLNGFVDVTNNGLSGVSNTLITQNVADPFLVGGYGNLLGQIFRRNYPSYSAGLSLSIPLRNRAAQADYTTSELSLRQSELSLQKQVNQVRVDVQNAIVGLQQARVRLDSSVKARILSQQTLDAEQKKYQLGASTVFLVVQDQRDLSTAQSNEVQALANYSHARTSFDAALGTTLEVHHVSVDEAIAGQVSHKSVLPAQLPNGEGK